MNDKISKWLRRSSPWQFALLILLLSYVIILPIAFLLDKPPTEAGPQIIKKGIAVTFISAIILAPLFETAMFQTIPIYILRKRLKMKYPIIILISALLFGLTHYYSIRYMIVTFLIGSLFSYAYIVRRRKNGHPYILITLIHSVRNFITFLISLYV